MKQVPIRNYFRDPERRTIMSAKKSVAAAACSAPVGRTISRAFRGVIPSAGVKVDTNSRLVTDRSRAQLFFGLYEGAEQRLARRRLDPAETVVELGTSIGFVSSVAMRATGASRLIGVEANPGLLDLARRNVMSNCSGVEVDIVHGAISYGHALGDEVPFSTGGLHTGSRMTPDGATSFVAPAMTLASVLERYDISSYTLIADIEGAEADVFLNDQAALRGCRQALVELHSTTAGSAQLSIADVRTLAVEAGFRVTYAYGPVVVLVQP